MADIQLKCPVCTRTITVSEFVDPTAVRCPACGEPLQVPERSNAPKKPGVQISGAEGQTAHAAPRVKGKEKSVEGKKAKEKPTREWRFHKHTRTLENAPEPKRHAGPAMISWIIFVILAGACFVLRYHDLLPQAGYAYIMVYSPVVYLAFHVLITLKAFKDSVFHGVLCLLLPPYALYYLFISSDDFYLRGIFGGMLVLIGQDTLIYVSEKMIFFFHKANQFIQGGALS